MMSKNNQCPESPAGLKWPQGDKNPRSNKPVGTPKGDTKTIAATPRGDTKALLNEHGDGTQPGDTDPTKEFYKIFEINNPSERRSSLARSPPRSQRSSESDTSITKSDGQAENRKKRKWDQSKIEEPTSSSKRSIEEESITNTLKWMGMIMEISKELDELIKKNSNTQRGIKEMAIRLRRATTSKIITETQEALRNAAREMEGAKETMYHEKPETQLPISNIPIDCTHTDFRNLAKKEWDKKAYRCSDVIVGNPIDSGIETQIVLLESDDPEMEARIQRLYRDRFPELTDVKKEIGMIERVTSSRMGENKILSRAKIIKASYEDDEKRLWKVLTEIKEEVKDEKRISIHHLKNISLNRLRKMIEMIFNSLEIKVEIYTTRTGWKQRESKRSTENKTENKKPTSTLTFEENGLTYKEILTKVKSSLKDEEAANKIKKVKRIKDGKLLMTIENDKGAIRQIKEKFLNIGDSIKIRDTNYKKSKTLIIRGIDEITTKDEITKAIKEATGVEENEMDLSELRPNAQGNQNATLRIDKDKADLILGLKHLRVGIVNCRVQERINVKSCTHCLGYGHSKTECKGPNKQNTCFKCGKEGHQIKECKEKEESCPACGTTGHRRGSMRCASFRKALAVQRKQTEKSIRPSVNSTTSQYESQSEDGYLRTASDASEAEDDTITET